MSHEHTSYPYIKYVSLRYTHSLQQTYLKGSTKTIRKNQSFGGKLLVLCVLMTRHQHTHAHTNVCRKENEVKENYTQTFKIFRQQNFVKYLHREIYEDFTGQKRSREV